MILTPAQLAILAPDCDAETIAPALSAAAAEWEINTVRRLAHFLGQLYVEAARFTRTVENLNYSAQRLMQVWPRRFPTLAAAEACAHNPAALAEKAYGGRLGNTRPGEGYAYRGRGLIQLTGAANYRVYGKLLGIDLIGHPELAAEIPTAARIAGAFWSTNGLNAKADADDIEGITRAINGALTGFLERKAATARAKALLGERIA
jgi:putative chitinase